MRSIVLKLLLVVEWYIWRVARGRFGTNVSLPCPPLPHALIEKILWMRDLIDLGVCLSKWTCRLEFVSPK